MGNQKAGKNLATIDHDLNLFLSEKVEQPLFKR